VRLKNSEIHGRINGNLSIQFVDQKLTSFSGLELLNRYFRAIGLREQIKAAFGGATQIGGDYRVSELLLTLVSMWFCGGNRLRHVRYLCSDWMVKRVVGVKRMATERTLSRWLKKFTAPALNSLLCMNSTLVLRTLASLQLKRITLDFDGTVLSTGNEVENAFRGYNPHKRFSKSYYPFLCHIAQTGHFLRVKNRRGNLHDSKGGALSMISDCIREVRERMGPIIIEVRLDSAFFSEKILRFLIKLEIPYAVKMPLWKWTGIKDLINQRERWSVASKDLSYFTTTMKLEKWKVEVPVFIFRKCIKKNPHAKKNFQLDLFDPVDGIYEYQVIATNQKLTASNVMDFYNGRCGMEREIAELKTEYGFANIPTKSFMANSAYQALAILAHTLVKNFQLATNQAPAKKRSSSRTTNFTFESLKTLRFKLIARAGRIVNIAGKSVLKMAAEPKVENSYRKIERALDRLVA
jgi:hypothetical protein